MNCVHVPLHFIYCTETSIKKMTSNLQQQKNVIDLKLIPREAAHVLFSILEFIHPFHFIYLALVISYSGMLNQMKCASCFWLKSSKIGPNYHENPQDHI